MPWQEVSSTENGLQKPGSIELRGQFEGQASGDSKREDNWRTENGGWGNRME